MTAHEQPPHQFVAVFQNDHLCDKCGLPYDRHEQHALDLDKLEREASLDIHAPEEPLASYARDVLALVAALKAAQQEAVDMRDHANAVEEDNANLLDQRAKLRADLTRVEADNQELQRMLGVSGGSTLYKLEKDNERLQARIAALEGVAKDAIEFIELHSDHSEPSMRLGMASFAKHLRARAVLEARPEAATPSGDPRHTH